MSHPFALLGLHPALVQTLDAKGYGDPTPIQSLIIPAMLAGRDVIGQSQTGSGKTAAFGLPILQSIAGDGDRRQRRRLHSLILTPTRELALQVAAAMAAYGRSIDARVLTVYGGQPYSEQIGALKKGVDIVVGTPGRIIDLLEKGCLQLDRLTTLVLDEADEMLSMGFIADIETILKAAPAIRQTGLFSATMPLPIRRLAANYLQDPLTCATERRQLTVATVEQRCYLINENDRLAALTRLFETEPIVSALVFSRTRIGTGELANELVARGFAAEVLNGDLGQDARERVLLRFRKNQIKVLVATDVAARGLDIDHVSHVFNYDLPQDPELYVHRIGRTGRAGRAGVAITLFAPRERWFLRRIETYTRQKMTLSPLPSAEEIQAVRDSRLVEQMMVWLKRGRCRHERELAAALADQGHDALDVAAAALKLIRSEEKQRPIAPISDIAEERPKRTRIKPTRAQAPAADAAIDRVSHEKGMVRLALSSGKAHGLNAGHIVGSLSHHADIPGRCIGRISIGDHTTFVDVPEQVAGQVLAKTEGLRIGRRSIAVQRA